MFDLQNPSTFLSPAASCNTLYCLLFLVLQDFSVSQQSFPASQVSPSAYPLPSHFPSFSSLLPEAFPASQPPWGLAAHFTSLLGSPLRMDAPFWEEAGTQHLRARPQPGRTSFSPVPGKHRGGAALTEVRSFYLAFAMVPLAYL